jgi:hypothetical protein
MRHVIVYAEPGTFAGWPANNGLWGWEGQELLVGFIAGDYVEQRGHNIAEPYRLLMARSADGGETWVVGAPAFTTAEQPQPAPIDFAHPNFALRIVGAAYHGSASPEGAFFISLDRGRTWRGPRGFGALTAHTALHGLAITARTDYVVEDAQRCLVLMSARGAADLGADRVFCARTTDGGHSFSFVAWVVPPTDPYRAVMPASVRCDSGQLVTAIRRREPGTEHCWIDAYASADAGRTWRWVSKVADTGEWNGNPAALTKLRDGRLCCAFGDRAARRMQALFSLDEGASWGQGVTLRDDFCADAHDEPDFGYARVCQRADGQLVAIYYWATAALPHQHIAATIWAP